MRVVLAGYNIDSNVLEEAREAGISPDRLTPEVLCAAYARISRDPRPVGELRREALEEVEKARKSNRNIIFGMGHHSVAEHAIFNFDLLGISRLAIEALEHFRLCSFTEKSQRYITLDHDFVLPDEISNTPFEARLCEIVADQSELYNKFNHALLKRLEERHPELTAKKSGRRLLNGWAKEDARYVTILATSGQLGFTANARNLELIVRRMAASPLAELRELGELLHERATAIAPSLLLFTKASSFDLETATELRDLAKQILGEGRSATVEEDPVRLVKSPKNPDEIIAAAMLTKASGHPFEACRAAASNLDKEKLAGLFEAAMRRMEFFDSPGREFEHVSLTFELKVCAACYGQLKRHRMTTQSECAYDPDLGLTVPPSIVECGLEDDLRKFADKTETVFHDLGAMYPEVAPYVLTNSHRRRVLITANLRDLYHFARLREDTHAQWDIRELAKRIGQEVSEVMPLGALLLCGKDRFVERFEKVFGRKPQVDPGDLDP
jgi:thymidylate synthase ThyX